MGMTRADVHHLTGVRIPQPHGLIPKKRRPHICHRATTPHSLQNRYDPCRCVTVDQIEHPTASPSYHMKRMPHSLHPATTPHHIQHWYDPCRCAPPDQSEHPTAAQSIQRSGGHTASIRRPSHTAYTMGMTRADVHHLTGVRIPQPHGLIPRSGGHTSVIGRPRHTHYRIGMIRAGV